MGSFLRRFCRYAIVFPARERNSPSTASPPTLSRDKIISSPDGEQRKKSSHNGPSGSPAELRRAALNLRVHTRLRPDPEPMKPYSDHKRYCWFVDLVEKRCQRRRAYIPDCTVHRRCRRRSLFDRRTARSGRSRRCRSRIRRCLPWCDRESISRALRFVEIRQTRGSAYDQNTVLARYHMSPAISPSRALPSQVGPTKPVPEQSHVGV